MATKARQQYFADEDSLQKIRREFSIADDIQQKIDSIEEGAQVNVIETVKVNGTALVPDANKAVNVEVPEVIDNLYTIDSDNALSAKQGKLLYDYIQNIASRGRFLSNWNSATGLPMTNPSESPYPYKSGDYFVVSNVASSGGTNYRPDGSSYIIGQASTVVETEDVSVSDFYFYDGTNWLLLSNSGRQIAVDSSLSTTSTNPVENRVITNALNDKANITDVLTKTNTTTYTPTTNYHPATKKYVDDNAIAFKAFPNTFDTTHTTQDFLDSIEAEHLPVGSAYLGQVSLSDMPSGVTVQGDVEVYVYPQNIIYAVMKSTDTSPYEWIVNSQYNRGWEPTNTDTTYTAGANVQISNQNVISATDTTYTASDFDIKDLADSTSLRSTWSGKQDVLTAGDNIQINGTTISATDTTYNAGDNITIEQECHRDTQGPCPNGFHIPFGEEWVALNDIGVTIGARYPRPTSGSSFGFHSYLKIPYSGRRRKDTGELFPGYLGNFAEYRGVKRTEGKPQRVQFDDYGFDINKDDPGNGNSIRAFKDEPIAPDSSWVMLYDGSSTAAGAGIFHNATLGLISLSSDGQTWITIADKNVGATVVYNDGDTLTNDNCGYHFQRGNNYGFPVLGNVTTSSTQVDASSYGPGNYYYSSEFILNSRWDSTRSKNLWGGETNGTRGCLPVISATDTKYTAGTGISIDANNVISATDTSAQWGNITGTLSNQTDLQNALDEKQDVLTAGENITIGEVCESDMQGPAPDGFHVPLQSEWQAVYDIWTALGGGSSDGTNFGIALKLPFAGYRDGSYASVYRQGNSGYYWSSSRDDTNNAYILYFGPYALYPQTTFSRASGSSVRGFKDTPTIPTSSWTKLYGTSIEAGGIFWSSTDGLISLSSDGQTWITIADKNLGATQVWNSGDTLSEANCGKYYQRGNNYGFPRTGSVTTSSTQVDASTYGPGNYYSSDTFITYNGAWDTTDNGNLWGGVSQGQSCALTISAQVPDSAQWGNITGTLSNQTDLQNALDSKVNLGINQVFDSTVVEIGKWEDEGGDQSSGHHVTIDPSGEVSTYNATVAGYNEAILGSGNLTLLENTALGGDETTVITQDGITITEGQTTKTYDFLGNDRIATLSDISSSTGGLVDDTAYGSSWDGVTTIAPSKNVVYDKISTMDTTISGKQDTLVSGTNIKSINNNSLLGSGDLSIAEVPSGGTNGQVLTQTSQGPAWQNATGGADIEYKTQAEYNALLPGALTDNKHYFIYTGSGPTPIEYTITGSTTVGSFTPGSFSDIQGFFMSPDGENAYITFWNNGNGRMAQYSLSTPWDISTASQTQYISLIKPNGLCFSNDGTYMFYSTEDGMKIVRYSLSTPRDISTASQDAGQSITVDSSRFALNVCISEDGRYIWYAVNTKSTLHQYELTTPYDLTTATNHKTLATSSGGPGVAVKDNGKYMYIADSTFIKQYELATPYDITSTATEIGSLSLTIGENRALYVSNDCKYWAIGNNSGGITQFEAQPMS